MGQACNIKQHKYVEKFIKRALKFKVKTKRETYRAGDWTGDVASASHLITIFSIAISLKAKRILELGVGTGTTTLPLLCAAKYTKGCVESVDIESKRFKCPKELKSYWKFYQEDTTEYLKNIRKGIIYDLIFIDDCHVYEHVKKELELLSPHLNKSSIVLLHDLMHFSWPNYMEYNDSNYDHVWKSIPYPGHRRSFAGGGPYRAVKEIDTDIYEYATIPVCNGLTILRKKK